MSKYYQGITNLPLSRFIDVVCDENLYALVISGNPSLEQLQQAWDSISIQYADAMKDNETRLLFNTEKELNRLKITHIQILNAISVLKNCYVAEFANALNKILGSSFAFDVTKPEEYDKELNRAYNRSKGILIKIQMNQSAYDAMKKKFGSDKKLTREYFMGILISLSDFAKYPIHDSITVFEFCDRVRRVNEYNDTIKTKTYGKR